MWEKAKDVLAAAGGVVLFLLMTGVWLYGSVYPFPADQPPQDPPPLLLTDPGRHVLCVAPPGEGIVCATASNRYAYLNADGGAVEFGTVPKPDNPVGRPAVEPVTVPYGAPLTLGDAIRVRMDRDGVTAWSTRTGHGFFMNDERLVRGTLGDHGSFRIGPHVRGCLRSAPCRAG